ncbi:MAG: hypothetical protein ACSHYA_10595 [Opitutaceae bacterium]
MSLESETPLPHDPNQLGQPMRSPKKRSAVFIVVAISVGVHVLGLGIFGVIKIVETISATPEFEAPPVVQAPPPPPPPPPPPTTKRSQKSLPRPQPLAAQNPQNMSVPAIVMQESDMSFGRGMGGGFGELGGGIMDRVDISFFGISGGNHIVVLFDRTGSGQTVFSKTRAELLKTIETMKKSDDARLAVIYFGGRSPGRNPTKTDFWWPKGVTPRTWLEPSSRGTESLIKELNKHSDPRGPEYVTKKAKEMGKGKAFFLFGTQYWGALNAAYQLDPVPDTIYFMVEPDIAFSNVEGVRKGYEHTKGLGMVKPEKTKVVFVVGKPASKVKNKPALYLMVNLINGGDLRPAEVKELIVFD